MKRTLTLATLTLTLPGLAATTALTVWLWLRAREAGLARVACGGCAWCRMVDAIDGEVA